MKTTTANTKATLAYIEEVFKEVNGQYPFEYEFLDQTIRKPLPTGNGHWYFGQYLHHHCRIYFVVRSFWFGFFCCRTKD